MTGAAGSFDKLLVAPVGRGNVSSTHGGTCDAEVGVGGARGDGAAPAGRDGGVHDRGLGAGGVDVGGTAAGKINAELLSALRQLASVFGEDGPLYEALLEAEYEDAANSERHPSFKHVRDTVLAKARAAIAKAEGRS